MMCSLRPITAAKGRLNASLSLGCVLLLAACGGGGPEPGGDLAIPVGQTPPTTTVPPPVTPAPTGFKTVSDTAWDSAAVRRVLRTFAYGGRAYDAQIEAWAAMTPSAAITEIITFDAHNRRIAPRGFADTDRLDTRGNDLESLAIILAGRDNLVPSNRRERYDIRGGSFRAIDRTWLAAALARGQNPVRQKIGLWETNYHMVTNLNTEVTDQQMLVYYDDIMDALAADRPYQDVLSVAASSAAVAMQYGHRDNIVVNGEFRGNEDFAREFHQLFFGILGADDPDHETVTIKNTGRMLTDMRVRWDGERFPDYPSFGAEQHWPTALTILGEQNTGMRADLRIAEQVDVDIRHRDSLENLPAKIIAGLADDNLNAEKTARIQAAWAAMPRKSLLAFLRAYATSETYHSADRVKYDSSFDRNLRWQMLANANNRELFIEQWDADGLRREGVSLFRPTHNVFGHQTGEEASNSGLVFRRYHNALTEQAWRFTDVNGTRNGVPWERDWGEVFAPNDNGDYTVADIADGLWNRLIADGGKHFGTLEKAHAYALVATGLDWALLIDDADLDRIYTAADIDNTPALRDRVTALGEQLVALNDNDDHIRRDANQRIALASHFIMLTPYMFAEEGR